MNYAFVQSVTLKIDAKLWLHGSSKSHSEGLVDIKINEICITKVPLITNNNGRGGKFILRPAPCLLASLPESYVLSIVLPDGEEVVYPEATPLGAGDDSLADKLAEGYLVSAKAGYLYKPPASQKGWADRIHKAYGLASAAIAELDHVSDLFIAYGSLLGQVRSGDFIAHDDDFDAAVLVNAETPADAARHFYRIVDALKNNGHKAIPCSSHLGNFHLYFPELPPVDIFLYYYRNSTRELCSYNLVFECDRDIILPLQNVELGGQLVLAPNQPAPLLANIYGDNWRTPDPYFQWHMSPRHDFLKHAYQAASRALHGNEPLPAFSDPNVE